MKNKYLIISVAASIVLVGIWFLLYGRKRGSAVKSVTVAALTALSCVGRLVFALFPHFKPVTAIVIIAGASLGSGAGFMTGALSAAISNMYFGQGPWTPFQMAVWGIIGMLSGFCGKYILKNKALMISFGAVCGALYSAMMDIFTMFSAGDGVSLSKYIFYLSAGLPVAAVYALSNGIFLWLLGDFLCRRLLRIKKKYMY